MKSRFRVGTFCIIWGSVTFPLYLLFSGEYYRRHGITLLENILYIRAAVGSEF